MFMTRHSYDDEVKVTRTVIAGDLRPGDVLTDGTQVDEVSTSRRDGVIITHGLASTPEAVGR